METILGCFGEERKEPYHIERATHIDLIIGPIKEPCWAILGAILTLSGKSSGRKNLKKPDVLCG